MCKLLKYFITLLLTITTFGICTFSKSAAGQERLTFEFLPGGAIAIPAPLFIRQEGYPDMKLFALYRTKSFHLPIYYSWRVGYGLTQSSFIELEMNHLKIYLNNTPTEIERFTITHGFNQVWLNYKVIINDLYFIVGLGPVVAHPENTIRGLTFDEKQGISGRGYYIAGITSQIALQKKYYWGRHFFLSLETKVNVAYAKVNVAEGFARVPVMAIHGLGGIGLSF